MTLADWQHALARQVMGGDDPAAPLSAGLLATAKVRRSWCEARASKAARLTLSVLPGALRSALIARWVDEGGGAGAFHALEADAFLPFIAGHLTDPSHELTVCRLEAALARATAAKAAFAPPQAPDPSAVPRHGAGASLVLFTAEPQALLAAVLGQGPAPPLGDARFPMLAAPGVPGLLRPADPAEVAAWRSLSGEAGVLSRLLAQGVLQ
jgi:hypothetical protein